MRTKGTSSRTFRYVIQRKAQMMFPTGITKPLYRHRIRASNPATGRAVNSCVKRTAIILEQSFMTSVTIKVNKKYVL